MSAAVVFILFVIYNPNKPKRINITCVLATPPGYLPIK